MKSQISRDKIFDLVSKYTTRENPVIINGITLLSKKGHWTDLLLAGELHVDYSPKLVELVKSFFH